LASASAVADLYRACAHDLALMVAMAAPAAPFLLEFVRVAQNSLLSAFEPIVAAATRLTRLEINRYRFEGPPPMIAAGRAAILAFQNDVGFSGTGPSANFFDGLLALLRSLSAAAAPGAGVEPPVVVRLEPLWLSARLRREQAAFVRELTSVFGRHLTRLAVRDGTSQDFFELRDPEARAEAMTDVARLLENGALPALRELVIEWWVFSALGVPLDLAGVRAPPPGLTFLSVRAGEQTELLLSPAIRAGLASLAVAFGTFETDRVVDPPQCLRGVGGSFGRLTRLVYGSRAPVCGVMNLAPWARPEFSIPTLVEMEAIGRCFTLNELGQRDRGSWCKGFLAAQPRLSRLVLRSDAHLFQTSSTHRSMNATAVRNVVTARLPRAARESGRRLDVAVHQADGNYAEVRASFKWGVFADRLCSFELALEAQPPR
jgi:hypothetical protein